MYMEGVLWKWTNYFSGWQARWFILDNGILSYYKSEEDVVTGCKGSVKISACDIVVHGTDHSRLDLIVPGEQHFYIKASNPQERQEWLVALGSTKASMGKTIEEPGNMSPDILRTKRSELRLYCDLLMQQVHSVKQAVEQKDNPDLEKLTEATSLLGPTCDTFIQTLDDCMKLIQSSLPFEGSHPHVTDAALPTSPLKVPSKKNRHHAHRSNSSEKLHSRSPSTSSLENTPSPHLNSRHRTSSNNSASDLSLSENTIFEHVNQTHNHTVPNSQSFSAVPDETQSRHSKMPTTSSSTPVLPSSRQTDSVNHRTPSRKESGNSRTSHNGIKAGLQDSKTKSQTSSRNSRDSLGSGDKANDDSAISVEWHSADSDNTEQEEVFLDPLEARIPTFFSVMNPSFMDIRLDSDGGIPVEDFLGASKSLIPIFDKLNATAFAPVKMDFQGNIRKVRTKHSTRPEAFPTLQSIILYEIQAKQSHLPNSASMALLWMKRSLDFITKFMLEIKNGEANLGAAASKAYAASLKPFHGWVVRGVFAVAVKALPYRNVFISLLSPEGRKSDDQAFVSSVMTDMETFITAVDVVIKLLDDFFKVNNLDSNEQV